MKFVVANHKMNMNQETIRKYEEALQEQDSTHVKLIICPSMLYLSYFQNESYALGSQNVAPIEQGSLTGEIAAYQLAEKNVKYCLVGHSERRIRLKEDADLIKEKIKILLRYNITPILCIGETKEQHDLHRTALVLEKELISCLKDIPSEKMDEIIIAYEPIWAIGTGKLPSNQEIANSIEVIKEVMEKKYFVQSKVLYGGSINPDNIETLEQIKNLDGYLIGGASLKSDTLKTILRKIQ